MNYKNKLFIMGLILVVLLSVSVVSAEENGTQLQSYNVDIGTDLNNNCLDTEIGYNDSINQNDKLSQVDEDILSYSDILISTKIKISYNNNVKIGESIQINASLIKPSTGQIIDLSRGNFTVTFDNNNYSAKLKQGNSSFILSPDFKEGGIYSGIITFSGAYVPYYNHNTITSIYQYQTSSLRFSITVNEYPQIIIGDFDKFYNSGDKGKITLIDSYSNLPLKNKYLQILLRKDNKVWVYSDFTNNKGICAIDLDCGVGEYVLEVTYNDTVSSKKVVIYKPSVEVSTEYIKSDNKHYTTLKATVKDSNGKTVDEGVVKFTVDGKKYKVNVMNGVATMNLKLSEIKTYKYKVIFYDDNFVSGYSSSKVKIIKYTVSIFTKKSTNVKGEYSILKAIVIDGWGNSVNEGAVKFTVDGKKYKVNVMNGVAIKKLKLSEIKTYKYKAVFSSKYYTSKASMSKVIVKKTPTYTVQIGKYSVKISYSDYKKIKEAQKSGYFSKKYYTGEKTTYNVYKNKKVVLTMEKLWMDDTATSEKTYPSAWDTPYGYEFSHYETKRGGGHTKTYMVYKKTTYKKVLVESPKTKVYIYIDSNEWWGTTAKLYYLESVYDGVYSYYSGKEKSIF